MIKMIAAAATRAHSIAQWRAAVARPATALDKVRIDAEDAVK